MARAIAAGTISQIARGAARLRTNSSRLAAPVAPSRARACTASRFRSYADTEVALGPGVTSFIGRNGQGKTNVVEAIDYIARLSSHRVSSDAPLVRFGAEQSLAQVRSHEPGPARDENASHDPRGSIPRAKPGPREIRVQREKATESSSPA